MRSHPPSLLPEGTRRGRPKSWFEKPLIRLRGFSNRELGFPIWARSKLFVLERQEEHKRRGQQEGRKKVPRLAEAPKQERQEGEQRSREKAAEAQNKAVRELISKREGNVQAKGKRSSNAKKE